MRYYVTARNLEDKQSLLGELTGVLDTVPLCQHNILVQDPDVGALLSDPRVLAVEPHVQDSRDIILEIA